MIDRDTEVEIGVRGDHDRYSDQNSWKKENVMIDQTEIQRKSGSRETMTCAQRRP